MAREDSYLPAGRAYSWIPVDVHGKMRTLAAAQIADSWAITDVIPEAMGMI